MDCFYHISQDTNPFYNLALEEVLLHRCPPNAMLLYLWQNENTVVIGRNQNPWQECRLEAFEGQKGRLARRLSGGGAVYHDLGNQNFTFLAEKNLFSVERQLEVVCRAVRRFGIDAKPSGRNDLEVMGRKFSGNAFHKSKTANLHHGTILIASDLSRLSAFLAPPVEKLQAKGIESVRSRVENLANFCPNLTATSMRQALLDAFGAVYGQVPQPLPRECLDDDLLERLQIHYASDAWRLGEQSQFVAQVKTRLSYGGLACFLQVEEGHIRTARIASDAMDADWICRLELALVGQAYQGQELAKAVPAGAEQEETMAFFAGLSL